MSQRFVGSGIERQWAAREIIRAANAVFDRIPPVAALFLYAVAAENLAKAVLIVKSHVDTPPATRTGIVGQVSIEGFMSWRLDELVELTRVGLTPREARGLDLLTWAWTTGRAPVGVVVEPPIGLITPDARTRVGELLQRLEKALRQSVWPGAYVFEETDLMRL